jgi:hypothetical protein
MIDLLQDLFGLENDALSRLCQPYLALRPLE